jgi:hypothetical protein
MLTTAKTFIRNADTSEHTAELLVREVDVKDPAKMALWASTLKSKKTWADVDVMTELRRMRCGFEAYERTSGHSAGFASIWMEGDPSPRGLLDGNYWFDHLGRVEDCRTSVSIVRPLYQAQLEYLIDEQMRDPRYTLLEIFRAPAHEKIVEFSLSNGWLCYSAANEFAPFGVLQLPWEVVLR